MTTINDVQRVNAAPPASLIPEKSADQTEAENQPKTAPVLQEPVDPASAGKKKEESSQEKKRVEAAAQQLNDFMKRNSIQLKFSVDAGTKEIVVKVVQKQTGKLIRQIPSEEALKIAKEFHPEQDSMQGVIVKGKV
jgi:flagellar protein FlaG